MMEEQLINEERGPSPSETEFAPTERRQERRERRGGRGITGAVVLIAVGVIVLLANLGVVQPNWLAVLRYWPVLLVLVGLDLLMGSSTLGRMAVAALGLAAVLWIILWSGTQTTVPAYSLAGPAITQPFEQNMGDVNALDVTMNLGAVEANITPLDSTRYAVSGDYRANRNFALDMPYAATNGTGHLIVQQRNDAPFFNSGLAGELNLGLTTAVPVDLTVKLGAGDLTLDLTGIDLRSLSVEGGAGEVTIILPAEGNYSVDISAGVGQVTLTVPQGLEARVSFSGGLATINVPDRFVSMGEQNWQTANYEGAANRTNITISAGVGEVDITD